jgi:CRISPR-associated endonuclease Cas2
MAKTPYLSGYRLMWIFVMFDLPVGTKKEMREATRFRQFLLDQGFEMSQFSVYARFCNGKDSFDRILPASSAICRKKATFMSLPSPTGSMRASSAFPASAARSRAKILTNSRCSDFVCRKSPAGWCILHLHIKRLMHHPA